MTAGAAKHLISPREALALLLRDVPLMPSEDILLAQASGRLLAEAPRARLAVPRFDNSAMDGYAFCAAGIRDASGETPAVLNVVRHILAGDPPGETLRSGEAVRIMTGAPLPPGADTVLEQERAEVAGQALVFRQPVPMGRHVRKEGELIASGAPLLLPGHPLSPAGLGWLIEGGLKTVSVRSLPRAAVLTTGNELTSDPDKLTPGGILDSNGPVLAAAVQAAGVKLTHCAHAEDDPAGLKTSLTPMLEDSDMVLITGGVSVGTHDFTRSLIEDCGARIIFHGVNQKPGKPMLAARLGDKFLLGLPGNPASALVCFYLYALPLLHRLQGRIGPAWRCTLLPMGRAAKKNDAREHFLRAVIGKRRGSPAVFPLTGQGSHALGSFAVSNALAQLTGPPGRIEEGALVPVISLEERTWS